MTYRISSAHEEAATGCTRSPTKGVRRRRDGNVRALPPGRVSFEGGKLVEHEGTGRGDPADLVLFAMGFVGPEQPGLVEQLGVGLDERGNIAGDDYATNGDGVFVAGDAGRGQSLIVWAIAEAARRRRRRGPPTSPAAPPAPIPPTGARWSSGASPRAETAPLHPGFRRF